MKKILIGLLIVLVVIQFIRPARNLGEVHGAQSLDKVFTVPQEVEAILNRACYDCHSNHTRYPWYANIQPVGWWLQHHVNEGKEHLNFSEIASYAPKKLYHKMEESGEEVEQGEMPLESYTWIHKKAKLTAEERALLIRWFQANSKPL